MSFFINVNELPQADKKEGKKERVIVPEGLYTAEIVKTEVRTTKDLTGEYIVLSFKIIEGEYTDQRVWHNLHLKNKNANTAKYAGQRLRALCELFELTGTITPDSLVNNICKITVKVKPAQNGYQESNDVGWYYPLSYTGKKTEVSNDSEPSDDPFSEAA